MFGLLYGVLVQNTIDAKFRLKGDRFSRYIILD